MSDSTLHPAHPDVELLADHAEELLTPEQSAELSTHLDSCPECRATYAALAELTALLGDEPAPGPMPEDVAARIDAALAAERDGGPEADAAPDHRARSVRRTAGERTAGERPAAERPSGDRPADNRPSTARSRRAPRMRRVLTTLAIVLAAGGIGLAVSRGGDIDSGSSSSSSAVGGAPALAAPSPSALAGASYDFTQANLPAEIQRLASDATRRNAAGLNPGSASSTPAPSDSGTAAGAGAGAGAGRMSPNTGVESTPSGAAAPADGVAPAVAPSCVLASVPRPMPPSAQGLGRYLGVQVFALLYPDLNDPAHRWDVYLVQDSCSAPLVLLHQSVPRA